MYILIYYSERIKLKEFKYKKMVVSQELHQYPYIFLFCDRMNNSVILSCVGKIHV